jgi:DNA repair exonuclease SbcCD ATPase subunit
MGNNTNRGTCGGSRPPMIPEDRITEHEEKTIEDLAHIAQSRMRNQTMPNEPSEEHEWAGLPGNPEDDIPSWQKIANLRQENERLKEELGKAAREIPCAGPIDHRIRILRQEDAAELQQAREEIADLKEVANYEGNLSQQLKQQLAQAREEIAKLREVVKDKDCEINLRALYLRDAKQQLAQSQADGEKDYQGMRDMQAKFIQADRDRDAMQLRLDEAVGLLEEIKSVASGEEQVADDDTGGMEWIDRNVTAFLAAQRKETHQ